MGVGTLLAVGAVVLFSEGEDLFGSDPDTIDSYNRDVLDSCQVPDGSTLVQTSVRPVIDDAGQRYRSMWYVYASPLPADEVAAFFGVDVDRSTVVPPQRACRLQQRPSLLVQPESLAGRPVTGTVPPDGAPIPTYDGLWADEFADVRVSAEVPAETQSLFRLRLAQREVEGLF